ncbi:Multimodular transpeptidase-transglycosylase [hydrothermal vent metagenome]|uniref:Penicillin-binding protein 1B n=1 Tax=hydrothermal vent metagenome TaxID=652676 RepID=A0A3B0ZI75_9ZZZZ
MVKRSSRRKRRKRKLRKNSRLARRISKKLKRLIPKSWKKWLVGFVLVFIAYSLYLNFSVLYQFEGKRWSLPAHVYARPLEIYVGKKLSTSNFDKELRLLNYRNTYNPSQAGTYNKIGNSYQIFTRKFSFWDGVEVSRLVGIKFDKQRVVNIVEYNNNNQISLLRLDPMFIGGIYPAHNEDRLLIKLSDVPNLLHSTLILVEDRKFYDHYGIDPLAILRALWVNLRAGRTVQGGSTLTQQLVKNFFLNNKRTLWRKANEALMSLMLEIHFEKKDIIQAYMNEIYLGQQGKRAIHGFGLGSQFYFDKEVGELDVPEIALMVAMIRGPHYYNPYRHPKRAKKRRDQILDLMASNKIISQASAKYSKQTELGIVYNHSNGSTRFPAFMDLVKRQLRATYKESDLKSEGLQVFTTLDPIIQSNAEAVMIQQLNNLQNRVAKSVQLQSAIVVTNSISAELLALVGDRKVSFAGFNRALDAKRSVGSLVKPAVYLAALMDDNNYNLITPISDAEITLQAKNGTTWTPKNYDNKSHGMIPLYEGLSHSYNQATVRLGMQLGLRSVVSTLKKLGVKQEINPYPSVMLGSIALSPYETAEVYQTIASGGFQSPIRAIREVLTSAQDPLKRYPIQVKQTIATASIKQLQNALQQVIKSGTGRSVSRWINPSFNLAGKTGTTNDLRDSWFAGFSGKHLAVVWVGADNNQSTGLTGASGALPIWARLMKSLDTMPLEYNSDDEIEYLDIDPETLLLNDSGCKLNVKLAFIKGQGPRGSSTCNSGSVINRSVDWFKEIFN